MGTVISKAANGIGAVLGNAFVAPIKTIFGASCEGVCSGTWDITCFIEHLCVSNLLKLLMVLCLTNITLLFLYLLFKVGLIQCIGRSLCKMAWAACETYWLSLEGISCFLWHKLKNTKRVYHRRFQDLEEGCSSRDDDRSSGSYVNLSIVGKGRSVRERRKDQMRRSLYPVRHASKGRHTAHSHHRARWKSSEVSVHVKGSSGRSIRTRNMAHVRLKRRSK